MPFDLKTYHAYSYYQLLKKETVQTIRGPVIRRTYGVRDYNCYGDKIREYLTYTRGEETIPTPGPLDWRSLKAIVKGCCPPTLMKDFIMTESGEMAERDAAAEAMELHK